MSMPGLVKGGTIQKEWNFWWETVTTKSTPFFLLLSALAEHNKYTNSGRDRIFFKEGQAKYIIISLYP